MHRAVAAILARALARQAPRQPTPTRPGRIRLHSAVAYAQTTSFGDEPDLLDDISASPLRRLAINEFVMLPSSSDPTKSYTVLRSAGGRISCDCPAWKYQKVPLAVKSCKHIKQVMGEAWDRERLARTRQALAIPEPPDPKPGRKNPGDGSDERAGSGSTSDDTTRRPRRRGRPPKVASS